MASVTFDPAVGGDGSIVTDDADPTTGLANGGHRERFVPSLAQLVAVAQYTVGIAQAATNAAFTPCRLATTANITLSGMQTLDSVAGASGDRVLVKDQTTASQNGIYTMLSGAWTRTADADTSVEFIGGKSVRVLEGTLNGGREFYLSTTGTITLGTTPLTFALTPDLTKSNTFSGANTFGAEVSITSVLRMGGASSDPQLRARLAAVNSTDGQYNPVLQVGLGSGLSQGGTIGSRTVAGNPRQGLKFFSPTCLSLHGQGSSASSLSLAIQTGALGAENSDANTAVGVLQNGNVGIGNVAPNSKLEVTGQVAASAGSATAPAFAIAGDLDTGVFSTGANSISLAAGGLERLRAPSNAALQAPVASTVGTSYNALYPGYMARAWVNFNGTGTVAIRASGNVSSITDNGVGDYTVNFTAAMPDTSYAVTGACGSGGVVATGQVLQTNVNGDRLTTSARIGVSDNNSDAAQDAPFVEVSFFR